MIFEVEQVNRKLEEMYRRIRRLEQAQVVGEIPRSPMRAPEGSHIWHDVENGQIKVWNGTSWDVYTKD